MWGGMTVVTTNISARMKKAKHHEIKVRYGWGKKRPLLAVLRESELNREYSDRYGSLLLPDDDSGRDDIEFMLHHLAPGDDSARRIARWLDLRAPWFTGLQRATMVERVLANPFKFNKDTAAKRIGLTAERRTRLNIRTIAAIDQTAVERKAASKARKIQAQLSRRRTQGVKPRKLYEGQSAAVAKPWVAEGVSRRTWYRRQQRQ
jgi:hypothetical protein